MAAAARRYLTPSDGTPPGVPSAALRVGDLVFAGGSVASIAADAQPMDGDIRVQARNAFDALRDLLASAGGGLEDVVDIVSFHSDSRTIEMVFDVGRDYFEPGFPAWTPVAVSAQRIPGQLLAISAIADLGPEAKQCIVPDTIKWWRDYPASAGCRKGDLLFVAGQYGSDADGNVNTPGDHGGQARNALNRVAEICTLAGGELDDVIDVTSFHQDPRWIGAVASVYEKEFFGESSGPGFPAWTAVGTPGLLKRGMLGQYRAIADLQPGQARAALLTATAVSPVGADGVVEHRGDPEAQARATVELLGESLAERGGSLSDVAQLVSFHLDADALDAAKRVIGEVFDPEAAPVWTAAGMTGTREEGQLHAISALALR